MTTHTWFYSLQSPLDANSEQALGEDFSRFLNNWKSHGQAIHGRIEIRYGRFVIVQSDPREDRPSGCSIDSMKRTVEEIMQHHSLTWWDPSRVFYRDAAGEIKDVDFREIGQVVEQGQLGPDSLVFDHSLSHTDDLDRWEVAMRETWLKRYLPSEARL